MCISLRKWLFKVRNKANRVFIVYFEQVFETKYSRIVKFFKGCLPQILLSLLMNTLSHLSSEVFAFWGIVLKFHLKRCFIYNGDSV